MVQTITTSVAVDWNLYSHQELAVAKLHARNGLGALLMDMRTGKTRTALKFLDDVRAERILIVCPTITFSVWTREIDTTPICQRMRYLVLDNTFSIAKRAELLKNSDTDIIITNYEAYWREPLRSAILAWKPTAVIADEVQRVKNRTTRQARFAHLLADKDFVKYRIPLTGTPITQGLHNIWSIFRFMDKTIFGAKWWDFQDKYLMMGGFEGREIIGYKNQALAEDLIADTSFRITRGECWDLPARQDIVSPVLLTDETANVYDKMRKDYIAQIDGVDEDGQPIQGVALAKIVLTAVLRLQQITSGHCTLDDGRSIELGTEKIDACIELIRDAVASGEHVVVFCRFRPDVNRVTAALVKDGIGVQTLVGGMTKKARDEVIEDGKWQGRVPVLVSQIKVGSLGVSMSVASTAIFFSVGFSLDDFQQAKDRLHGADQTRNVGYYFLEAIIGAKPTVDHKVYDALSKAQNLAGEILRDPGYGRSILDHKGMESSQ